MSVVLRLLAAELTAAAAGSLIVAVLLARGACRDLAEARRLRAEVFDLLAGRGAP